MCAKVAKLAVVHQVANLAIFAIIASDYLSPSLNISGIVKNKPLRTMRQCWFLSALRYRPATASLPPPLFAFLSIVLSSAFFGSATLQGQTPPCQPFGLSIQAPVGSRFSDDSTTLFLCSTDSLVLTARGRYFDNNRHYRQSDDSTRFRWQLPDGSVASGARLQHTFPAPGIYPLRLAAADQRGCAADKTYQLTLLVAGRPQFAVDSLLTDTLCFDQPLVLALSGQPTISAMPRPLPYPRRAYNSDSLAIPDGEAAGISTVIQVAAAADSTLRRPGQLPLICATIEHSSLYDLAISLECPSGKQVMLHPFTEKSNQVHLGIPNLTDENGGPSRPGRGGDYCWGREGKFSWNDFLQQYNSPPAAVFSLPAGTYAPADPLSNLLGCPLAGAWTLRIVDKWSVNNGWLLGWRLEFPGSSGSFAPAITRTEWTLPTSTDIDYATADSLQFRPKRTGPLELVFSATDTLGCTTDTTVNFTVLPPDSPYCQPPPNEDECTTVFSVQGVEDISCKGADDGQALLQYQGNTAGYRLLLNERPIALSPLIDSLRAGTYRLELTDGYSCSQIDSFVIREPAPLQLRLASQQPPRCAGAATGMVQLTATGGRPAYLYRLNDRPFSPTASYANLSSGLYLGLVRDSLGCTDSLSFRLTEPDSLQITFTTQPISCQGNDDGAISARFSGGTGMYTYRWSNGSTRADLSGLSAGRYCVTVTDGVGCTRSRCETLTVPDQLKIDTILSIPARCYGESSGQAIAQVSGGLPPYRYRWNDRLAQLSDTAVLLSAGTYELIVTDEQGCTARKTVRIMQPDTLMSNISVVPISCLGLSDGRASIQATGGQQPYRFEWSGAGMRQGDTIRSLSAGTYQVTITDSANCSITDSLTVQEPPDSLRLTVSQVEAGCQGLRQNIVRAVAGGGHGAYRFHWSNGREGAELMGVDTGRLQVTLIDQGGCQLKDTLTVVDLPAVDFLLITEPPTCKGDNNGAMGITRLSGGAGKAESDYTFAWSTGSREIAITNLAGGREYSVTVTGPAGCTRERKRLLPDPIPVSFQLESLPVSCYGAKDGRLRLVQATGPNDTLFTLRWNGGTVKGREISGLAAGRYTVTVTDNEGCSEVGQMSITQPDPLRLQLASQEPNCFGVAGGSISAQVSGGTAPYTLAWSNGLSGPDISGLMAGQYTVTVTDQKGCTISTNTQLSSPNNIATDVQVRAVTCAGERDGRISIVPQGGTPPYRYSLNDLDYSGSNTFVGLAAGNYTVFIRDGEGCTYPTTVTLPEPPALTVELGPNRSIIYGDSLTLSGLVTHAVGAVDYFWEAPYPGTLSCLDCPATVAKPEYDIDYRLIVIDENGCEASDQLRVSVEKIRLLVVPTGFTPNQDGRNDRLIVHGRPGTEVVQFDVFDRWGELVYRQENFPVNNNEAGWDGLFNGQPAESGVYVWRVRVRYEDGSQDTLSGQTLLSR